MTKSLINLIKLDSLGWSGRTGLLAISTLICACEGVHNANPLIVGGSPVGLDSPAATSTVALVGRDDHLPFCTGTLVAPDLVISAAHCVESSEPKDLAILFGESPDSSDAVFVDVIALKMAHPDGSKYFPNLDIAWLRLAHSAPAGTEPVEVLRDPERLTPGTPILLAGYGRTRTGCSSDEAGCSGKKLEVASTVDRIVDDHNYRSLVLFRSNPDTGACNGDSGGPAYVRLDDKWFLVGATNGNTGLLTPDAFENREGTCEAGHDIYTFIGGYAHWIEETSGLALTNTPTLNPVVSPWTPQTRDSLGEIPTWEQWFFFDNLYHSAWYTKHLLIQTAAYSADPSERLTVLNNADVALELLKNNSALTLTGKMFNWASLSLIDRQISNLEPLASLPWLTNLELTGHRFSDIKPLTHLVNLRSLTISDNTIIHTNERVELNLESLTSLTQLTTLNLADTGIRDLNFLYALSSLQELDVSNNPIEDLTPILALPNLKKVKARALLGNALPIECPEFVVCDFDPPPPTDFIEHCEFVKGLNTSDRASWPTTGTIKAMASAVYQSIYDWTLLDCNALGTSLSEKTSLNLEDYGLKDLTPVGFFSQLTTLKIKYGKLQNLQPLANLVNLTKLDLQYSNITDPTPLWSLPKLNTLILSGNKIVSLEGLAGPHLQDLDLSYNEILDIKPLANLERTKVNLIGNPITEQACPVRLGSCQFSYWNSVVGPRPPKRDLNLPQNSGWNGLQLPGFGFFYDY